ncbi:MAG: thiamine phosphate synthase [Proteobacteria bacterium]|nr:thiamine phosphate synthase [Pseudomonadota bacterium]
MTRLLGLQGCYAIVDPEHCGARTPEDVAAAVLRGGCRMLQLRVKRMGDRAWLELGGRVRALCRESGAWFVVNDRPDLALLLDADGLHLGQNDLPIAQARRLVGALPIGISTHSLAQAREAEAQGADLIGFGPVFGTSSKREPNPEVGLAGLSEICRRVCVPVAAIGGISPCRAPAVARAGARFACSIGALCSAADPEQAARTFQSAFARAGELK